MLADNVAANKPRKMTPENCHNKPVIRPPVVMGDLSPGGERREEEKDTQEKHKHVKKYSKKKKSELKILNYSSLYTSI